MNAASDAKPNVLYQDFLSSLTEILEESDRLCGQIEHDIERWVSEDSSSAAFPVDSIQNLDLVRQLQADVLGLLRSDEITSAFQDALLPIQFRQLMKTVKLETSQRMLTKNVSGQNDIPIRSAADVPQSGMPDLF